MGPKTFQKIIDHMFPIRETYRDKPASVQREYKINNQSSYYYSNEQKGLPFGFPFYAGLPIKVVNQLSSEAVDAMQYILQKKFVRKRDFSRAYKKRLFELGENLR